MPNSHPDVFETISQSYYELTTAERKAADYVMKNRDKTQYLSIGELAEESGVAEAPAWHGRCCADKCGEN